MLPTIKIQSHGGIFMYVLAMIALVNLTQARANFDNQEIARSILASFNAAKVQDKNFATADANLQLNNWYEIAKSSTNARGEQAKETNAAIVVYFVNGLNNFLNIPNDLKNQKANSFFAKLFLTKEQREEIIHRPVSFDFVSIKENESFLIAKIQLWPDLTGTDSSAQLTFFVSKSNHKIIDLFADSFGFLRTFQDSISAYKNKPKQLVDKLIEKGLVTKTEISEYQEHL